MKKNMKITKKNKIKEYIIAIFLSFLLVLITIFYINKKDYVNPFLDNLNSNNVVTKIKIPNFQINEKDKNYCVFTWEYISYFNNWNKKLFIKEIKNELKNCWQRLWFTWYVLNWFKIIFDKFYDSIQWKLQLSWFKIIKLKNDLYNFQPIWSNIIENWLFLFDYNSWLNSMLYLDKEFD